jgi:plasmid stabilization system protein ParE
VKIRFTLPASRQLDAILAYIEARSPQGAGNLLDRIDEALALVAEQPRIGRATNRPGFRRIVITPHPYVIIYRASSAEIVVHSIRHTSRRPRSQ